MGSLNPNLVLITYLIEDNSTAFPLYKYTSDVIFNEFPRILLVILKIAVLLFHILHRRSYQ